jgi:FKBP-type peptidyl-prolyl cis-trans isomerase FkpA
MMTGFVKHCPVILLQPKNTYLYRMRHQLFIPFSKPAIWLFALLIPLCSCKKKISQEEADEKIIKQYISDKGLNAKATGSGLYYVVDAEGTGDKPNINSTVTVVYRGTLTNGTEFDKSSSTGATFLLSNVIKGWQEGIPLYKKGGKGKLLIPSALGYGNQATGKIPASSVLIFDVELLDVK